ncbi:MAG: 4-hydroxy-tetrahydrodipicolinate synthase [Alphaproteobacteria bacterium]|jgi:4-hydroxy-tetrahydrodipicolinate synthase|nr:4-hydroxy-tetrahydrodipicolinate synthase [Alphaproteobacteria bacterium]MBU2125893.1 4-hydroxy-tetrahydrodipicolinate synthase [Alphaproteobacteria bacterium]MBU2209173.1 4-hydroxy-tetrahydrodipicolinate synthase [Alphaproteobacteria bacterium]MBU2291964.1 4-hydroxy-tetrahydrodipicolinate synthase [Alphaproteobacteria bacterium]MBU2397142.1 4-hydroxy-tetrahydrodipicolinate synthase [Alphaproteobacteria bacterium]
MTAPLFKGVITALITPLRDGKVDEAAFTQLLERQIGAGIHGVVPMGTTGESASLTADEHKQVVELCVRAAAGRVRVIAGAGASATDKAIDLVRFAKTVGADGALVVTPYYNRPSQAGLAQHFEAIAEAVQLPLLLYNVPGRTGVDLANETVARLAAHPNVVGIKDATGDLSRVSWMRAHIGGQFDLISGDDPSYLGYHAQGGVGVISVSSNVAPEAMVAMHEAAAAGDYATARDWQDRLIGLHRALFLDNSPAPTKYALSRLGLCSEEMRLPLSLTSDAVKPAIDRAMADAGLG